MNIDMPKVQDCSVSTCAYNTNKACHAMAITVGEPAADPVCDTYFQSATRGGIMEMTAGVGACKSSECQHNSDYECTAQSIHIGMKEGQPDCLTFKHR